uniref:Aminoglycoside phosphotransferase domain-containing protein n=1 Tax=Candidatus Kentrum sp. MB TaxID=2138164 RepID=A0A450XPW3_9GAMM|nr:MAG: hypothetical protein BECKMB1821G_GA0114241_10826 [Candidatus Kentron sp. MB]VFK34706.1 MAG: hypothetical protein BECKMB1821I_GA0114274_10816 [Candidatus Kentron sp. MB]VFK76957.1 MAG: hypothetical protein BECKMB1821H_GA0114242_10865 [Candidatus Kentron sp. MB]
MHTRLDRIKDWLAKTLPDAHFHGTATSEDASFRRYFRVSRPDGESFVVMDAPPEQEDSGPFVRVAALLRAVGVNAPEVLAMDLSQGFLLLSDLGTVHYLDVLDEKRVQRLYGDAMGALLAIQACVPCAEIPEYHDALLEQEMRLFPDWFLVRHLGIRLTDATRQTLQDTFAFLRIASDEQPKAFVHRDYHSRNLMACARHNPGILDFQDAVLGPITYDLVSLLKDVYITWPEEQVEAWALGHRDLAIQHGILSEADPKTWLRWFDLMGVQRHIKIVGIFARLRHRDGKPGYLADIPRTLHYLRATCRRYPELTAFGALLEELQTDKPIQKPNRDQDL